MRFYRAMKIHWHILCTIVPLLALLFLAVSTGVSSASKNHGKYLVYVGTYTEQSKSRGIYAYRFDADSGDLTSLGLAAETSNPSFLAVHPNHRFLYAVNEVASYKGPNSGGVSAFAIDRTNGKLTFLNQVASRGADPCYVTVDKTGKYVLVANYTGGSVAAFPVLEDAAVRGRLLLSFSIQATAQIPSARRARTPTPLTCPPTITLPWWMISAWMSCSSTGSTLTPDH